MHPVDFSYSDDLRAATMIFSLISTNFFLHATDYIRREHPEQLGSFLHTAFETTLSEQNGQGRRQAMVMGRMLLDSMAQDLVRHEPDSVGPLAALLRDKSKAVLKRKTPICCNSMLVKDVMGPAFVKSYTDRWDTVGCFLNEVFTRVEASVRDPDKLKLFPPLGRRAIEGIQLSKVADPNLLQDAWMKVKTRSQGPLDIPDAPDQLRGQLTHGVILDVAQAPIEPPLGVPLAAPADGSDSDDCDYDALINSLGDLDDEEEPPRRGGARVDIVPEEVGAYAAIVCDENEPAFIQGIEHPRQGRILVMVAVSGFNSAGQMVYRGGLVLVPELLKDVTHRYFDSVIEPVSWDEDDGTRMLAKAIRWQRDLYGKYWTNVKRSGGTEKWGDIESLKRYFILGGYPEIRLVGKDEYDRHRRRVMAGLRRRQDVPSPMISP